MPPGAFHLKQACKLLAITSTSIAPAQKILVNTLSRKLIITTATHQVSSSYGDSILFPLFQRRPESGMKNWIPDQVRDDGQEEDVSNEPSL
jgi:hypothetical protein